MSGEGGVAVDFGQALRGHPALQAVEQADALEGGLALDELDLEALVDFEGDLELRAGTFAHRERWREDDGFLGVALDVGVAQKDGAGGE